MIVTELYNYSIWDLMATKQSGLNLQLVRSFATNTLSSLVYMKSLNIIHMDIKPQNIMVKDPMTSTKFIIIDYGSAVSLNERKN